MRFTLAMASCQNVRILHRPAQMPGYDSLAPLLRWYVRWETKWRPELLQSLLVSKLKRECGLLSIYHNQKLEAKYRNCVIISWILSFSCGSHFHKSDNVRCSHIGCGFNIRCSESDERLSLSPSFISNK